MANLRIFISLLSLLFAQFASASSICDQILTKMHSDLSTGEYVYQVKYFHGENILKMTVNSITLAPQSQNGSPFFSFYYDEPKVIPDIDAYISSLSEDSFQSCLFVFAPVSQAPEKYRNNKTNIVFALVGGTVTTLSGDYELNLIKKSEL